jgi:hypothetical protein
MPWYLLGHSCSVLYVKPLDGSRAAIAPLTPHPPVVALPRISPFQRALLCRAALWQPRLNPLGPSAGAAVGGTRRICGVVSVGNVSSDSWSGPADDPPKARGPRSKPLLARSAKEKTVRLACEASMKTSRTFSPLTARNYRISSTCLHLRGVNFIPGFSNCLPQGLALSPLFRLDDNGDIRTSVNVA